MKVIGHSFQYLLSSVWMRLLFVHSLDRTSSYTHGHSTQLRYGRLYCTKNIKVELLLIVTLRDTMYGSIATEYLPKSVALRDESPFGVHNLFSCQRD